MIQQEKNNQGHPLNAMLLRVSQHEDHGDRGDTLHLRSSVNKLKGGGVQVGGSSSLVCVCPSVTLNNNSTVCITV